MAKPIRPPPTAPYDVVKRKTPISDVQVAQAAYNAGFRGPALVTAVAVAFGEAGRTKDQTNATALNNRGEFSVGMFQINVNGYLAKRLQRWGYTSWIDLWDPDKNARAAYKISQGGKHFGAWSVYKHGTYLKFMNRATAAVSQVNSSGPTTGTPIPEQPTISRPSVQGPSTYYPITSPNVLPVVAPKINDPLPMIFIAGAAGLVLIGILLISRKQE